MTIGDCIVVCCMLVCFTVIIVAAIIKDQKFEVIELIRYYFNEKDYDKIHEGNICAYCKARNEECGENPYCCYLELCRVVANEVAE